jgi:glycosyltransferase involved in cell wall biosynthesis
LLSENTMTVNPKPETATLNPIRSSHLQPTSSAQKKYRMGIVAMHPIQYHAPIYRELAKSAKIDLDVLFLDQAGMTIARDPTMGADIQWDVPLLDGYRSEFIRNWSLSPLGSTVFSRINPGIVWRILRAPWDAVLIQGYQPISCWLSFLAARLSGKRVLFRGESCVRKHEGRGWKGAIKRSILRLVFSMSDTVLYSCSGNRKFFEFYGCPPEKLAPIPCAVDNKFFRRMRVTDQQEKCDIRSGLGIPKGVSVVLNIGRMAGLKRQQDLLQATAILQRRGTEVAIVFVGDGPAAADLKELVKTLRVRNVHFVGFVNQTEVSRFYSIADIFTICSEFDPSPKVVSEALNFSLPLISSDRPGQVGDTIIHRTNALIYPCGDVKRLTEHLENLVQDAQLRDELGSESLRLAGEWSLDADVASVEQLLDRLFKQGNQTNALADRAEAAYTARG